MNINFNENVERFLTKDYFFLNLTKFCLKFVKLNKNKKSSIYLKH